MIDTNRILYYENKRLKINLAYNAVIKANQLFEEELFSQHNKLEIALYLLVDNIKAIKKFTLSQKTELLGLIYKEFIISKQKDTDNSEITFDFIQDMPYIYASFMMDYGINLIKEENKLDWREFIALFGGLSDRTKIKQVMSIREKEVPAITKDNQKEVTELLKAKRHYSLDNVNKKNNFQDNMDKVGAQVFGIAKR